MTTKKQPTKIDDPALLAGIGCVPMTDEATSKMSLNPYDQLFICRLMNLRDEERDDVTAKKLATALGAFWDEALLYFEGQNKGVVGQLEIQTQYIKDVKGKMFDLGKKQDVIQKDITAIKKQVDTLEKNFSNLVKEVDDIRDHKIVKLDTDLSTLHKEFKRHTGNTWKNIAFGILTGVLLAVIAALLIHYNLPIPTV